jgi:hypothetical protein
MNPTSSSSPLITTMIRTSLAVAVTLVVAAAASAADSATAVSPMRADALHQFARQLANAPAADGPQPAVIGTYIWSGRADINYRPFFQWELRLRTGKTAIDGLRGRIVTYDFHHKPLATGDWQTLPSIAAGKSIAPSFHLNCMTFAAWQLDLTWTGGAGSWIGGDKVNLPAALDDSDACAMVVNASSEPTGPTSGAGPVTATFTLWNVGKKPAKGVTVTLHFRDANGKEIFSAVHHPKTDPLPAGAATDETETVKRVPAFAFMDLSCEQPFVGADDPGFTGAKDIEIAFIRPDGKQVKAKVRNGYDTGMDGVVVHLGFKNKNGDTVGEGDIPVDHLKPGEIREITGDIPIKGAYTETEVGWSTQDVGGNHLPASSPDGAGSASESAPTNGTAAAPSDGKNAAKPGP